MAKYYLGTFKDGKNVPIKLEGVGTKILDVVNYTMSFVDEIELREQLLQEGKIEYYTDDLSYLMEEGPKGNKSYKVIPMGNKMVTITSKEHFDIKFIRRFLKNNMYNQEFYASLLVYYLRKLNIDEIIKEKMSRLLNSPVDIYHFTCLKKYYSEESARLCDLLEQATTERDSQKMHDVLYQLKQSIMRNNHDLINTYYYFRKTFKNIYTGTVERIDNAYRVIVRANQQGIEEFEFNRDEDKNLSQYIDEIFNHLIYQYDSTKKEYKKDTNGNKKVTERNQYELGMFIDSYIEYQRELEKRQTKSTSIPEEDYEHEEFLEEEDFTKLHTTSEREGYSLRKTDGSLYHL